MKARRSTARFRFSVASLAVFGVGWLEGWPTWRGAAILMILYGTAWDIDDWFARRRLRR